MDEKKRPGWGLAEGWVGWRVGEGSGWEQDRQVKREIYPHQPAGLPSAFK